MVSFVFCVCLLLVFSFFFAFCLGDTLRMLPLFRRCSRCGSFLGRASACCPCSAGAHVEAHSSRVPPCPPEWLCCVQCRPCVTGGLDTLGGSFRGLACPAAPASAVHRPCLPRIEAYPSPLEFGMLLALNARRGPRSWSPLGC